VNLLDSRIAVTFTPNLPSLRWSSDGGAPANCHPTSSLT